MDEEKIRTEARRNAVRVADYEFRDIPGEHPTRAGYRWNQLYWAEWGRRMKEAGLKWFEEGREPEELISD